MFYRRKVILSILEAFGGELEKFQLQELLMLFSLQQRKPSYYFVPYKYGCYSFQANADLSTMRKYEWVEEGEQYWKVISKKSYKNELNPIDQIALIELQKNFKGKSSDYLIKHTYLNFPYYAIKSKIAHRILSESQLDRVHEKVPQSSKFALFTIGYEGLSIDQYINIFIEDDVKFLCDVRNNSLSMKFGFSKLQLEMDCKCVGIQFLHFSEVGFESNKRKELNSKMDYD